MTLQTASRDPRTRFNALVDRGTYSTGFTHARAAREFVGGVVDPLLADLASRTRQPRILDVGCGTGAWLSFVHERARMLDLHPRLYGFDVADRMVATAEAELAGLDAEVQLRRADLQDPACCRFDDDTTAFDLVFAYDVVQQLDGRDQFAAVRRLAEATAPGGATAVFDHERWSRYGVRMGWKKFVTATTGIALVPRHYCAAAYPPLARFSRRMAGQPGLSAEVIATGHAIKRALVLRRATEV